MRLQAEAIFEQKPAFEYHLYTLERPVTLVDRQTKQIPLCPPATVKVGKAYRYEPRQEAKQAQIVLEFKNDKDRGLGIPLPARTGVRIPLDSVNDLTTIIPASS